MNLRRTSGAVFRHHQFLVASIGCAAGAAWLFAIADDRPRPPGELTEVQGVARDFAVLPALGRGMPAVSFALEGRAGRIWTNSLTSIPPAWAASSPSIRVWLPADAPAQSRDGARKSYGLWVDGKEVVPAWRAQYDEHCSRLMLQALAALLGLGAPLLLGAFALRVARDGASPRVDGPPPTA